MEFGEHNPALTRHHHIAFSIMAQLSAFGGHLMTWAQAARYDDHLSPCAGKKGTEHLELLVDGLRRVLVLEAESGRLPRNAAELARREALYVALHAYFGVRIFGDNL